MFSWLKSILQELYTVQYSTTNRKTVVGKMIFTKNDLEYIKIYKKAHLISNFIKNLSLGGARTHEKEQKIDEKIWRFGGVEAIQPFLDPLV